jgi:hypothetical protein
MTFKEARKLKKGNFVWYLGRKHKFIRLEKIAGNWYVVANTAAVETKRLLLNSVGTEDNAIIGKSEVHLNG